MGLIRRIDNLSIRECVFSTVSYSSVSILTIFRFIFIFSIKFSCFFAPFPSKVMVGEARMVRRWCMCCIQIGPLFVHFFSEAPSTPHCSRAGRTSRSFFHPFFCLFCPCACLVGLATCSGTVAKPERLAAAAGKPLEWRSSSFCRSFEGTFNQPRASCTGHNVSRAPHGQAMHWTLELRACPVILKTNK